MGDTSKKKKWQKSLVNFLLGGGIVVILNSAFEFVAGRSLAYKGARSHPVGPIEPYVLFILGIVMGIVGLYLKVTEYGEEE